MPQQPSRVSPDLVLPTTKGRAKPAPVTTEMLERRVAEEGVDDAVRQAEQQATMAPRQDGPPLKQGKVALNFRLYPELHQRLRKASYNSGTSIQQIVEEAVTRHLTSMGL